jgi:serine/threonine-protein phosphatase 5
MWKNFLSRVHSLTKDEIVSVIDQSAVRIGGKKSLVRIPIPESKLTICGDIHGQFADLQEIFKLNGLPNSKTNPYMFNGDFVDRGPDSKGCILTLLLWGLIDPGSVLLNRGNHELMEMNAYYGFRKELKDDDLFLRFNKLFSILPISHVVGEKIFVVHGGLPRKDVSLEELSDLEHELLWNDPSDQPGITGNPRGDGVYRFGPDITDRFLKRNKLELLVRSHEMVNEGFEFSQNGKCVTVFSASNYTGYFRNKGAFLTVDSEGLVTPHQFSVSSKIPKSRL